MFVVVQNRAPIPLSDIRVTPVLVDAAGRVVRSAQTVRIAQAVPSGDRVAVDAGIGQLTPEQQAGLRFRIDGARVVER